MYRIQFEATTSADWAQAIELIDANTDLPLVIPEEATFELDVRDRRDCQMLEASSANAKLRIVSPNIIEWRFPKIELGPLCDGITYAVGCTMTTEGGTIQLFIGSLAVLNGEVA